jgi:hypothetical protein
LDPSYLILALIGASLVVVQVNQRVGSPVLAIMDRWMRWLGFSFGAALVCRTFALIDHPYWMLAAAFFLLWFLGETLYNWLAISALSVSPMPLFPRYAINQSGEEWPVQPRLLKIRDWLRKQGFRQVQALKAEIGGGIYLRVSIYQDESATTRVQITFLPQANGTIVVCYALTSITSDGRRFVTDNLYTPFGGFYHENWFVVRRPWCRSLPRLLARHRARLAKEGALTRFTVEPATELNATQNELDRLNTELGFLHRHTDREDLGKITQEGRYRVWKEIWMLNYLGRSARYH